MSPPTAAPPEQAAADFEQIYRANVAGITAFFARRCGGPQAVAERVALELVELGGLAPREAARALVALARAGLLQPHPAAEPGRNRPREAARS
jgi:hypothetical protein